MLFLYYAILIIYIPISNMISAHIIDDFEKISDPAIGPQGMSYNKTTSCKTFEKNARFNPHAIVGSQWFVFYYWAPPKPTMLYKFWIPSKQDLVLLHRMLDGHTPPNFNWSATLVMMMDVLNNSSTLLVELGDRGQYWMVNLLKNMPEGEITDYHEVRFKQTGDNKYVGAMVCKKNTAYIMSRIKEVPRQNMLHEEAAKLGFRGRKGKSYLYQGHEWMPVPELDEKNFWGQTKFKRRFMID